MSERERERETFKENKDNISFLGVLFILFKRERVEFRLIRAESRARLRRSRPQSPDHPVCVPSLVETDYVRGFFIVNFLVATYRDFHGQW